jgi:hypothetical protein
MKKTLTYSGFAATSLLEVFAFVSANTYIQLGVAIIFYPLLMFFAYKIFISKRQKTPVQAIPTPPVQPAKQVEVGTVTAQREDVSITDIDKRVFLKLIGATGLSFFVFSLFNRRSESLFFGKSLAGPGITALEDSTGSKIDPAERQPTDSYLISEIDDNYIAFYGFTNKDGAWFIMKEDPDDGSFRYIKGESSFTNNWADRNDLAYDYYHNVFS